MGEVASCNVRFRIILSISSALIFCISCETAAFSVIVPLVIVKEAFTLKVFRDNAFTKYSLIRSYSGKIQLFLMVKRTGVLDQEKKCRKLTCPSSNVASSKATSKFTDLFSTRGCGGGSKVVLGGVGINCAVVLVKDDCLGGVTSDLSIMVLATKRGFFL